MNESPLNIKEAVRVIKKHRCNFLLLDGLIACCVSFYSRCYFIAAPIQLGSLDPLNLRGIQHGELNLAADLEFFLGKYHNHPNGGGCRYFRLS